jgi:hypothetical protein
VQIKNSVLNEVNQLQKFSNFNIICFKALKAEIYLEFLISMQLLGYSYINIFYCLKLCKKNRLNEKVLYLDK